MIFPLCLIFVSVNWVSIGSGYGLSPIRYQAITWPIADLLSSGHLGTNFSEIRLENKIFIHQNVTENIACEMVSIFPGICVK